jgi:hypothetical protein
MEANSIRPVVCMRAILESWFKRGEDDGGEIEPAESSGKSPDWSAGNNKSTSVDDRPFTAQIAISPFTVEDFVSLLCRTFSNRSMHRVSRKACLKATSTGRPAF